MRALASLIFALCLADTANAAEDKPLPVTQVMAQPIERTAPSYPTSMLSQRQQGWVELDFVVDENGDVVDPIVVDSSGQRAFERAALKTVLKWQFEPARQNGKAIPQRTGQLVTFALEGAELGVSRRFARNYRKVERAMEKDGLSSAEDYLDKAFALKGLTLGETSWLWAMRSRIASLKGDQAAQLSAIRRALTRSKNHIPEELRASLMRTRFVLEANRGRYARALKVFEELDAMDNFDASTLAPYAEKIQSVIDGDQLIAISGKISPPGDCPDCAGRWWYQPVRRSVALADIDGELDQIELRCDWARYVDTPREAAAWTIPESWGDCWIVLTGAPGTLFKVMELPSE